MTPDLLLRHFDRIADAPDAVPRLRRFILDPAVWGEPMAYALALVAPVFVVIPANAGIQPAAFLDARLRGHDVLTRA
jgi:hypothetical protein